MAFKDNLRSRREELGMTQLELAKAAGITTRTIYNYESGERRPSNIEVVQRIANALGSTTEELLSNGETLVVAAHERGGADILHDHGVRARSRNVAHSIRKRIQLRIQQKRVERDMHAHLPRMAIRHGALEGLRVKVCRVAARVESGKAEIDRIRATAHRR